MAEDDDHKYDPEVLKEVLYKDAITEKTEKAGRTLLAVGTLTLVLGMYDIQATSSALIPLDFSKSPEALGVLFSVFNLFLLIGYILRFSTDVFRGKEDWALIDKQLHLAKVDRARRTARKIDEDLYNGEMQMNEQYAPLPEEWWEEAESAAREAKEKITIIEEQIGDRKAPQKLWMARFLFFGFSPIAVAVFALLHSGANLRSFIQTFIAYG